VTESTPYTISISIVAFPLAHGNWHNFRKTMHKLPEYF